MKVFLAGYNIDADTLDTVRKYQGESVTPEVISAAYARVTRDPRSIRTLRREARRAVESARESNERIVFEYGHASIAEHAVFNFDIIDLSRLAVEELERFRLASYTEKSQRYIRLDRDIVVPREIEDHGMKRDFRRIMLMLHQSYENLLTKMTDRGEKAGVAREDARYLMPLSAAAQLGMTVNARELEYMIGRLASHPLEELRELSAGLASHAKRIAPSLVRYPEPTGYYRDFETARREIADLCAVRKSGSGAVEEPVKLIDVSPRGDKKLAASILFSTGGCSFEKAVETVSCLGKREIAGLISRTFEHIKSHDSVWREFEHVGMTFEAIVSASCFAQLKRHRMATLTAQPYDMTLGVSLPESVRRSKTIGAFRKAIGESEGLCRALEKRIDPATAVYALTNAHRRRVLISLNLRELYHFSRLRSDRHAQWEIRELSDRMCRLAAGKLPAGSVLLAGKGNFEKRKKELSG